MRTQQAISPLWFNWLLVVVLGIMAFGISMVLAPAPIRTFFSLLLYAGPGTIEAQSTAQGLAYITLVHGVLGAVMFGWGTCLLLVLYGSFRQGSLGGWRTLAISVAVWFVLDTLFSLSLGFWQNAVLNTAIALLFAIPLSATYRAFIPSR